MSRWARARRMLGGPDVAPPGWLEPPPNDLPDALAVLARELRRPQPRPRGVRAARGVDPERLAAVLVLLGQVDGEWVLPVCERAAGLRSHAGQAALPGGKVEPRDANEAATALREAEEEIGVRPDSVVVLGQLPRAHVPSGFDVTAVIGWWREPHEVGVRDPGEVAAVHLVRVSDLTDPARQRTARRGVYRGPAFDLDGLFVWGLTAHLIETALRRGGWLRRRVRGRTVEVPERFRRRRG